MKKSKAEKKNNAKIVIMAIVAALLILAIWSYFAISNRQHAENLTYQNDSVPFKFDYPKSWSLNKTMDNKNDLHIDYVTINASDTKTDKKLIEIRYNTYAVVGALDIKILGTNCAAKTGNYQSECSYITNSEMKNGYFYRILSTNYWDGQLTLYKRVGGEKVFDKTAAIRITLADDSAQTQESLTRLAESIRGITTELATP